MARLARHAWTAACKAPRAPRRLRRRSRRNHAVTVPASPNWIGGFARRKSLLMVVIVIAFHCGRVRTPCDPGVIECDRAPGRGDPARRRFTRSMSWSRMLACRFGPRHAFVARPSSKPALAAPIALEVLEAAALTAGAAEVEFLDVLVVAQLVRRSVQHDLALVHDVAVARDGQRRPGVLLHQQDRHT